MDLVPLSSVPLAWFRRLPLRYRMSVPFLLLAFFGTFSLVWLAIGSQNELIREHEEERLFGFYRAFEHGLDLQGRWALSLATSIASDPDVTEKLAQRDRIWLLQHFYPVYLQMKEEYGISQFLFEVPPDRAFLRLHRLYEFGDSLGLYRRGSGEAMAQGKGVYGLEGGLTGYGIRGTAPVIHEGTVVGAVEIGFTFWTIFLQQLKKQFHLEASILVPGEQPGSFEAMAATLPGPIVHSDEPYQRVFRRGSPELVVEDPSRKNLAILIGPIHDYKGVIVGLVELSVDRTATLKLINDYWRVMLGVGVVGMVLSVGAIYLVAHYFTKPIARMVSFAHEIATGERLQKLDMRPSAELGVLADALNDMLEALEESKQKIRDYTHNLEQMVHLRTRALRESEEKYRTLVENVPLVVYRLLGDGRFIFVNHVVEELLGIAVSEVIQNPGFWRQKVLEDDRERIWPLMERCLSHGQELKAEYRVRHANGNLLYVLDHAMPVLDENGKVETVDGFIEDLSDRHQLQEQILQTEELRTLSEVSARLAHEIRNPLVSAGGFARRLLQTLDEDDPHRDKVKIIVSEVARLERILERTIAYLKPFELLFERASLNDLVDDVLVFQEKFLRDHGLRVVTRLDQGLPQISLDQILFKRVLESLMRGLSAYARSGGVLQLQSYRDEAAVHLDLLVDSNKVDDDDIDHFFYPFISQVEDTEILDLPLAKMVIHKHGGLVHLRRQGPHQLLMEIGLPIS
jgi:PAS domain S-box-containing protein